MPSRSSQITLLAATTLALVAACESTPVPRVPSASRSTMAVDRPSGVRADGLDQANLTVTVRDAQGQPLAGQTVRLAVIGGSNALVQPPAATDAGGVARGSVASSEPGTKTVTATVNSGASAVALTQSLTVEFVPASAAQLAFTVQPSAAGVRSSLVPAIEVSVQDSSSQPVPTSTAAVTIALGSGGATLSGTLTVNAVNGVARFSDLTLDNEGSGYTLIASAPGLVSATSAPFDVSDTVPPGPVSDLRVASDAIDSVVLDWTAPGDDGSLGSASAYRLRFSTSPIDASNFVSATPAAVGTPRAAGQAETATVSGLSSLTVYYFALESADSAGNTSLAFVSGSTAPCPIGYDGPSCSSCAPGYHPDPGGACVDACTGSSPCNAPPADSCSGAQAVRYANPGQCAPTGSAPYYGCTYTSTPADCAATPGQICYGAGACIADPCAGVTCAAPAATCGADGLTLTSNGSACVVTGPNPADHLCQDTASTTDCALSSKVCYQGACAAASAPAAGDLLITELMHTPTAAQGEWFEVKNLSGNLLNLAGLAGNELASGQSFTLPAAPPTLLPAGGYFVFGQSADLALNGGAKVDYVYPASFALNPSGHLSLVVGAVTVDDLSYDASFPQTTGKAMSLSAQAMAKGANGHAWYWCDATAAMSGGDFGTPGAANADCGLVVTPPVDFCVLQWPKSIPSLDAGMTSTVYGRFYEPGVTDRNGNGNDGYPFVKGELGYGPVGSDPSTWTWSSADFNPGYPGDLPSNDDEMQGSLLIPGAGNFSYGFRFQLLDPATAVPSTWTYCDQNGVANPPAGGIYGTVTVPSSITSVDYPVIAHGGKLVLAGSGFTGASSVTVGGIAQTFTVDSGTQITIAALSDSTPMGAQGVAVVSTAGPSTSFPVTVIHLVINELDTDQPSVDTLELVEISTGVPNVSLAGYVLVFFNGNAANDASYFSAALSATADANGLLLTGDSALTPAPAVLLGTSSVIQNGGTLPDAVAIYQGSTASFPNNTAATSVGLIDALVYDVTNPPSSDPALVATLLGSGPQAIAVSEGGTASATQSIKRCGVARLDGSSFSTGAPSPGAANTCP